MSATVQTPLVPGPIQGLTREEPQIEALLPDDYAFLVHLAYLILPPSISRPRRVTTAHAVVQRALPPETSYPREVMRQRVIQEAARQASRRTPLGRLSSALAPPDATDFTPCARTLDPTTLRHRTARGRRVAITFTLLTTLSVLASLLLS
ncbi:hypothetical protein ACIBL3_40310 [Kribbella sp. NPDC050124]|uniref:hypothetical protein n=1 Tax=Kribbella sp. NPDC050124 TaxID=3364114 RepID=UPI003795FBE0